jgi:hypothetical protein
MMATACNGDCHGNHPPRTTFVNAKVGGIIFTEFVQPAILLCKMPSFAHSITNCPALFSHLIRTDGKPIYKANTFVAHSIIPSGLAALEIPRHENRNATRRSDLHLHL